MHSADYIAYLIITRVKKISPKIEWKTELKTLGAKGFESWAIVFTGTFGDYHATYGTVYDPPIKSASDIDKLAHRIVDYVSCKLGRLMFLSDLDEDPGTMEEFLEGHEHVWQPWSYPVLHNWSDIRRVYSQVRHCAICNIEEIRMLEEMIANED